LSGPLNRLNNSEEVVQRMSSVGIRGYAYTLNHTPELALYYGNTPHIERLTKGETDFLKKLPEHVQSYTEAKDYAPNQVYIGGLSLDKYEDQAQPWYENRIDGAERYGKYGEIMPEDEFLGFLDISDVFDIIWLEKAFASAVRVKLNDHPVIDENLLGRLEEGHEPGDIEKEIKEHKALPLYIGGKVVGCARSGHELDDCLFPYVLLENLASKAGAVLSVLHLLKNNSIDPSEIDFVIECSEEGAGDMNQRAGGNFAKAIAEIAGLVNASGCDVRGFCAGPVNAMIAAASQVAGGARKNCLVVAGGAIPKLYMNARDHVKKEMPALEDCLGSFAVLLQPDDGTCPVMRLDALGKHTVGTGSSPQAITSSLVWDPLEKRGLSFNDVDKYAAELHTPEITLPAGAGNVPLANAKMIAALAVMKKQLEKKEMMEFVKEKGLTGFAHTQGHIPSGVPFVGHACDAIKEDKMTRAMIIGKGSLFLARLTNLSDGASFLIEKSEGKGSQAALSKDDVKQLILEALGDIRDSLQKD